MYGYYFELSIGGQQYVYQNNNDSIYWTTERGSFGIGQIAFLPDDRSRSGGTGRRCTTPTTRCRSGRRTPSTTTSSPNASATATPRTTPARVRDTYLDGPVEFHSNWLDKPYVPGDADGSTTDDDVYNNDFFGGDLAGIIDKLDYLKTLGVNTLYINPDLRGGQQPQVRHRRLPATSTTTSAPTPT